MGLLIKTSENLNRRTKHGQQQQQKPNELENIINLAHMLIVMSFPIASQTTSLGISVGVSYFCVFTEIRCNPKCIRRV